MTNSMEMSSTRFISASFKYIQIDIRRLMQKMMMKNNGLTVIILKMNESPRFQFMTLKVCNWRFARYCCGEFGFENKITNEVLRQIEIKNVLLNKIKV